MKVNELARVADISPHVVRFYARIGLLNPAKDPHNGYKRFGQIELKRVRFIRMAQCLGYTLSEIRSMLLRLEQGEVPCDLMEKILRERMTAIYSEIELLHKRRQLMERALVCLQEGTWQGTTIDALCNHFRAVMEHA